MILVTVGSTYFDELIEQVDQISRSLEKSVLCQIGSGKYIPSNCEYFRFSNEFELYLKQASIIITHGGATVLQCIKERKKFIAIANTSLADDHQTKFLSHLSKHVDFPWTRDVHDIEKLINTVDNFSFQKSDTLNKNLCNYLLKKQFP